MLCCNVQFRKRGLDAGRSDHACLIFLWAFVYTQLEHANDMQAEEAALNPPIQPAQPEPTGAAKVVETVKDLSHTLKDTVSNLAHNIPEPVSKVLNPITAALHPHSVAPAPAPAGADTEVHVDEVDQVS